MPRDLPSCAAALLLYAVGTNGCQRAVSNEHRFVIEPMLAGTATAGMAPLFSVSLVPSPAALLTVRSQRVVVDDPVFRRKKTYEGFRLAELVNTLATTRVSDDMYLVLVCLDGYRPTLTMRLARTGRGLLAAGDAEAAAAGWEDLPPGSAARSPAPFYLVWEPSAVRSGAHLPWPYGVTAIEVWASDPLDRAKPSGGGDGVASGYRIFAEKCIACHTINGAGGSIGPELNTPANVTEYWNHNALRLFIRNPGTIRSLSKMPEFPDIADAEIDCVIAYLEHMKHRKVAIQH